MLLTWVLGISKDGHATVSLSSAWPPSILLCSSISDQDFPSLNLSLLPLITHLPDKPDWPKILQACLVSQHKNLNKPHRQCHCSHKDRQTFVLVCPWCYSPMMCYHLVTLHPLSVKHLGCFGFLHTARCSFLSLGSCTFPSLILHSL